MTIPLAETLEKAEDGIILLPFPPSALSGHSNGASHWGKAKLTKQWRGWAMIATQAVKAAKPPQWGDIHLEVSFYPPNRRGDRTNFANRCKPIFDGIADAWVVNDSRFVPHYRYCEPEKPGRVEIRLLP